MPFVSMGIYGYGWTEDLNAIRAAYHVDWNAAERKILGYKGRAMTTREQIEKMVESRPTKSRTVTWADIEVTSSYATEVKLTAPTTGGYFSTGLYLSNDEALDLAAAIIDAVKNG